MADASVQTFDALCPQNRLRSLYFGVTTGAIQVETLTFPAQAGATQGDFVVIYNKAGESLAAYIDIDSAGIVPTASAYVNADYKVAIAVATGDLAADVAAAFAAVAVALPDVTFDDSAANGTCLVTQDIYGAANDATFSNAAGSGAGSITGVVGTQGVDVSMNNGKYDGSIEQTALGTFVVTFNQIFARIPEVGVTVKTDNRVARVTNSALGSVTIELQNLSGGAAADGNFSLLVFGSDAVDFNV